MDSQPIIQVTVSSQYLIDILSALLTPTIAILGSIIAWQQWRTNRARLKHELFDRRYEQFSIVRDFISSIMTHGKVKPEEEHKYLAGTRGMRFIFDKEIASYVDNTLWHLSVELHALDAELEGVPVGEERSKNVKRQREIKELLNQELKNLEERFSKYLQLQH